MQFRSSHEPLQTPEQLDGRFGLVAGLYVAALLSPAVLLIVIQRLQVASWPVALGSLGAVGAVLTVTDLQIPSATPGDLTDFLDSSVKESNLAVLIIGSGLGMLWRPY